MERRPRGLVHHLQLLYALIQNLSLIQLIFFFKLLLTTTIIKKRCSDNIAFNSFVYYTSLDAVAVVPNSANYYLFYIVLKE